MYKVLEDYESLQACKDKSLTGELEERLIATARLGEYGYEVIEDLEIAILDEDESVRALAVVMTSLVAGSSVESKLKQLTKDDNPKVKAAAEFAISWLDNVEVDLPEKVGDNNQKIDGLLIHDDEVPLRTSDTVSIKNDYSTGVNTVDFEVTLVNESDATISDVEVRVLGFPYESLKPPETRRKTIKKIGGRKSECVNFTFRVFHECVEGEIITSVVFNEGNGERVSGKAGNCFIRSFYDWIAPVDIPRKDAEQIRKDLKYWGREHDVNRDPNELYEMFLNTFQAKNLHIYHKEKDSKKKSFMGSIYGIGKGDFTDVKVIASVLIVGDPKERVSKVRLDIHSDNPEILHTAASELYETTLRLLGEI